MMMKTIYRTALIGGAGAILAACQTGAQNIPATPLAADRHQIRVEETAEQFEFAPAPHAVGLQPAERAALARLMDAYAQEGRGPLVVSYPRGSQNEDAAVTALDELRDMAYRSGLPANLVQGAPYDAAGRGRAPVSISYMRLEARGPECGQVWTDISKSYQNGPTPNFGCATKANLAAMIADPADLLGPRAMTPPDAVRRAAVLEAYRAGEATAAERTEQETGTVSDAVE